MRESKYLTNCIFAQKRDADYKTLEELKKIFVPAKMSLAQRSGSDGNLAMHVKIDRETKRVSFTKDWISSGEGVASLYEAIPSALALYRLCTYDEVQVEAYGQEGYKCTWMTGLVHAPSGRLILFGEHKGAFSFWTHNSSEELKDKAFIKDLSSFLSYLIGDNFAHPYDGLVAGSVA